jgi:hypothetical protein
LQPHVGWAGARRDAHRCAAGSAPTDHDTVPPHATRVAGAAPMANATLASGGCNPLPSWGVPVGIVAGVVGSVGINIGQNLQATGLLALPPEDSLRPHKSRLWIFGLLIFILFSLVNFAALALAPASILTPLESIQFVTNIAWNKLVNRKAVSRRMLVGVLFALFGTVLTVVFGAQGGGCHSAEVLSSYWTRVPWWAWFASSVSLALASWLLHASWSRRKRSGERLTRRAATTMPIAYTLAAALLGGSQMIVHSKVLSELLAMLFQGEVALLRSWLLYVELVLVVGCGSFWGFKLTECLALYDPLLILPLMVGTYILFGGVGAGIFFEEFATVSLGAAGPAGWVLYLGGMALLLAGLGLIADASDTGAGSGRVSDAGSPGGGGEGGGGGGAADRARGGGARQSGGDEAIASLDGVPTLLSAAVETGVEVPAYAVASGTDPDLAAVSAMYAAALASSSSSSGGAKAGGVAGSAAERSASAGGGALPIAPRLLAMADAPAAALGSSFGMTLESVPESEAACSAAAASERPSCGASHSGSLPRSIPRSLSGSRPLSSSIGPPLSLSLSAHLGSSRPLSSSIGRSRPLASVFDLTVAVEALSDYERSLTRACSSTPLASRMPTPLASLRAASQLAKVRSDLSILASHPDSPLSAAFQPSAASGSSGTGGAGAAGAINIEQVQGGGGGRWPAPSDADLADDEQQKQKPQLEDHQT